MSKRQTDAGRRKLSLKKETLARLSQDDLARVAGGTGYWTWGCDDTSNCLETACCDTHWCGYGTTSKFC